MTGLQPGNLKDILQIRAQIQAGQFEFSRHAFHRVVERNISETEIRSLGANAQVIEEYPEDKYSPSALLLGFTPNGRPLHFQVSLTDMELVKIITIYEPDLGKWADYKKRI
ncbi:MAG: DUF4258 domain-containing protein [Nitrospinae bacterium]|nr:DUF4258 domain-containing protein [Nitrospinota bacterium]